MSLTSGSASPDATALSPPGRPPPGRPPPPTQAQITAFDDVLLTSLVLVTWEILVHLFQDLEHLRMKGWWRRPVFWAYFLQRYGAVAVIASQANIRLGHPPSCVAAGYISLIVGGVIVLPAISLIYLYRVLAIWNRNNVVKYVLSFMWVIVWGASCTAPFGQRAIKLPTGGCTISKNEKFTSAGFIANAIYDGTIFLLTIWKLIANRRQYKGFKSPMQTILLRDGVLYFAVSVAIGITDIAFLEGATSPIVASTVIPLHIALASIMTSRLVNNVFHVVKEPKSSGAGANFSSKASGTVGMWRTPGATGNSTTVVIGSGVGTEHFDLSDKPNEGPSRVERRHDGNKDAGNRTFNVPMQVLVAKEAEMV